MFHFTASRRFDGYGDTKDGMLAHPTIDATTIVADQVTVALDGLDEMQVLSPVHPHQHNVTHLQFRRIGRRPPSPCRLN
ncbi:MAG: hypothetical protein ABI068_12330 [Ktedonobacterales bacterium]